MIDIVRDYASIGMGTTQAATSRVVGAGRSGVERIAGLAGHGPAGWAEQVGPREALERGREVVGSVLHADLDGLVARLGLVKKSELNAVRMHVQRLERRLGEVRGER